MKMQIEGLKLRIEKGEEDNTYDVKITGKYQSVHALDLISQITNDLGLVYNELNTTKQSLSESEEEKTVEKEEEEER